MTLRSLYSQDYTEIDVGKVVIYTTTLGVIRETYARCVKVRQILRTLLIRVEERDVFMSRENQGWISIKFGHFSITFFW